jgi:hypothetical protein
MASSPLYLFLLPFALVPPVNCVRMRKNERVQVIPAVIPPETVAGFPLAFDELTGDRQAFFRTTPHNDIAVPERDFVATLGK